MRQSVLVALCIYHRSDAAAEADPEIDLVAVRSEIKDLKTFAGVGKNNCEEYEGWGTSGRQPYFSPLGTQRPGRQLVYGYCSTNRRQL